jgi:hypothetical protein
VWELICSHPGAAQESHPERFVRATARLALGLGPYIFVSGFFVIPIFLPALCVPVLRPGGGRNYQNKHDGYSWQQGACVHSHVVSFSFGLVDWSSSSQDCPVFADPRFSPAAVFVSVL